MLASLRFQARASLVIPMLTVSATTAHSQLGSSSAPARIPMSVAVRTTADGATYAVPMALVCVGNTADSKAYGYRWTGTDGRATIDSVPFGQQVYVTADRSSGIIGIGNVQGKRINYVLKSASATLVMHLVATNAPGPNCETPIGAEPVAPPIKAMPAPDTTMPTLIGPLKTSPGPLTPSLVVQLYTTPSSPNFLSVSGVPASYAVNSAPTASGLTWYPATITGWDRMQAVNVTLAAGEGEKTLYFFLKNAQGTSPAYAVDVTYVDLTPCKLKLTRAGSTTYGSPTTTQEYAITRGQSLGWAADGTLVVAAENKGAHTITMGYVSANAYGDEFGAVNEFALGPGGASSWGNFRSVKYAKCP